MHWRRIKCISESTARHVPQACLRRPPWSCRVVRFCWSAPEVDVPWPAVMDAGVTPGDESPGCSSGKGLAGLRVCNGRTKSFPRPAACQWAILIAGKMEQNLTTRQPQRKGGVSCLRHAVIHLWDKTALLKLSPPCESAAPSADGRATCTRQTDACRCAAQSAGR